MKHIDLDDDPTEDILYVLDDTCEWIDEGLKNGNGQDEGQRGVLVHCTQGMSRSGAVVVGYCEFVLIKAHHLSRSWILIPT
jgi:protein-tyrosine phosphatase